LAIPVGGVTTGSEPWVVATTTAVPSYLTVGGNSAYWLSRGAGSILRVSTSVVASDVAPHVVATGVVDGTGLAFDSARSDVYWAAGGDSSHGNVAGGVYHCPGAGCGASEPEVLGSGSRVTSVASDDSHVYWTDTTRGDVWKAPK
jgi:hypothetical protein